jgi:hypothetical protein
MKRMKVMFGQRRIMILATLAILVLAAAALVASSASFTATSANAGNIFTAGTMTTTNTSTLATINGIMPDDTWHTVGTVQIGNTGGADGRLTMTTSGLDNPTPGANGALLSDVLQLRITRLSDNVVVYAAGHIDAVGSVTMGDIAVGDDDTYRFEVMFPDGDTPTSGPGADNDYKLSSMTINFDWEMINL